MGTEADRTCQREGCEKPVVSRLRNTHYCSVQCQRKAATTRQKARLAAGVTERAIDVDAFVVKGSTGPKLERVGDPPAELRRRLEQDRREGRPFWGAWAGEVAYLTPRISPAWLEALTALRDVWEREYEGMAAGRRLQPSMLISEGDRVDGGEVVA